MKNILVLISFAMFFIFGTTTLYAQGQEKQWVPITPYTKNMIEKSGLNRDTVIIETGGRFATHQGECSWSADSLYITKVETITKFLTPKGVIPVFFNKTVKDTFVTKTNYPFNPRISEIKTKQPKKFGVHIFVEQVFARDFGPDHHQINELGWMTTRVGGETSPWGDPWDIKIWGGFYPRRNFKESFDLPTTSANPAPDEGWCDCKSAERTAEFSLGASGSRKIPLAFVGGGELALNPTLELNVAISGNPVPETKWVLPGAITLGVPLEWQTRLKGPDGKLSRTTFATGFNPHWQFAKGAHQGFGMDFFFHLALDTGLFKGWF